jgi:hypothetical protein
MRSPVPRHAQTCKINEPTLGSDDFAALGSFPYLLPKGAVHR